ncbi:MAG: K(+)-transporting ATPase subunit F [Proteobacteria bacterium]|nr:K(+)-transporting ATPase subunit F [Pseudomonadota bacterium]
MEFLYTLSGITSILLVIYLLVALLKPEIFQ